MPKLNVQQNNQNVIKAFQVALETSHDNLLDNAYFVGGGSQLGDGIFPINQRGQTSYTGNTYTIDRWVIASSGITVTPNAGYIELSGTAGNNFSQVIAPEKAKALYGKTVTVSALMYDGTILTGTGIFPTRPASGWDFVGFVYGTDAALIIGTSELYRSEFFIQTQSASAKICAVKLELGSVSTLANDVPPNFGEELAKCKAYFQRVKQPQGYTAPIGFGIIGASSNILRTLIPLSSPLRDATSITASATNIGQMKVWGNGSYFTPSAITGRAVLNGHAVVDITVSGSLQNYMVYHIILHDASTYIDLSAEL